MNDQEVQISHLENTKIDPAPSNDQKPSSGFSNLKEKVARLFKRKPNKIIYLIGGIFISLVIFLFVFLVLPLNTIYKKVQAGQTQAASLKQAITQKDIGLIKSELDKTGQLIDEIDKSLKPLGWLKAVPKANQYYADSQRLVISGKEGIEVAEIVLQAIEPYSDFLGFASDSEATKTAEKTTEDRIDFLVESVSSLKPKLDEIEKKMSVIGEQVEQIDSRRYPEEFKGYEIRKNIDKAKQLLSTTTKFVKEGKPLLEKADWLLGKDEPRKYLFMFQNDGELRSTGGFWTAYAILSVDDGKVSPVISQDIYALDSQFNSSIPAPRPIKEYHKNIYYLNLRDMNLSPDFKTSIEEFMKYYGKIRNASQVDGVIAVDTNVLVDILAVLGGIGVPGWGNFLPEPDDRCWGCPQVVYQLEMLADKPVNYAKSSRKGFLGPLMHSIIANAFGSPKEKIAPLAEAVWQNLQNKHILVYFPDEKLQKGIEGIGVAGRIKEFDGDYFHFNDSNFGGAKSNLFITQKIKQEYTSKGGVISKKVTINYKNSAPASNCNLEKGGLCLNGLYRDWFRLYVPQGSQLTKLVGSEVEAVVYDELGKTVFEGFFGDKYPLRPEGIAKVTYQYELPFENKKELRLLIQKQPGKRAVVHEVFLDGKPVFEGEVNSDLTLTLHF